MARTRNTADLLLDVAARVGRPAADGLLSDAELLDRIDEEMRSELTAKLVSVRSEYLLRTYTTSIVSGTASYRIPDRAIGMGLRELLIVDANSNEFNATQVDGEDRFIFANAAATPSGAPFAFTFDDGKITLLPTPAQSGYTLKLRYYGRMSQLVETTAVAAIASMKTTSSVTLTSPTPPSTISTTGAIVDIVRGDGMHESMYEDLIVSGLSGSDLSFTTSVLDSTEIANSATQNQRIDYVCPRGQTVYPPVPEMLWPALIAIGCRVYCEAIKDTQGMEIAQAMYLRHVENAMTVMKPRIDGEALRPIGRSTPLRGGMRYGWWPR